MSSKNDEDTKAGAVRLVCGRRDDYDLRTPKSGVYLTYAAPRGHALIDRALYLPRLWAEDPDRCDTAGIPQDDRGFATKPTLAAALIERAVAAEIPAAWAASDEYTYLRCYASLYTVGRQP